ncbi:hypothetical protein A7982_12024 [Minicystis rosea]|nr:hypothetical protein A7982_12024 [Minicystis rosea]
MHRRSIASSPVRSEQGSATFLVDVMACRNVDACRLQMARRLRGFIEAAQPSEIGIRCCD